MKYLWKEQFVDEKDIKIDLQDRGYQFGDGIYEVVHIYNGKLFALQDHVERLQRSAALIEMNLTKSTDELCEMFQKLANLNDVKNGYVYVQVTRGDGCLRNHGFKFYEEQSPVYSGFAISSPINRTKMEKGTDAITVEDRRSLMCNVKSLNLLPNCLAKHVAQKAGVSKALMVRDGIVTEEKSGNILIVKDGKVLTHPDSCKILPGITKKYILKALKDLAIPYEEKEFSEWEMLQADEVMVTDTNSEIVPVIEINNQKIGDGTRGSITKKIQKAYVLMVEEQCGIILK